MSCRLLRTTVGLAVTAATVGVVMVPAPAMAALPLQTHTLSCDDGSEVVLTVVQGNAFMTSDSMDVFVVVSGSVVIDDETIVIQRPNGTQRTRDLVTCTFINRLGYTVTVDGFYTPGR